MTPDEDAEGLSTPPPVRDECTANDVQVLTLGDVADYGSGGGAACLHDAEDAERSNADDDAFPAWLRRCFANQEVPSLDEMRETERRLDQSLACGECNKRAVAFRCAECELSLCFTCADAIHIIRELATHAIHLIETQTSESETTTGLNAAVAAPNTNHPNVSPPPPLAPHGDVATTLTRQFNPPTQIEQRLHLPVGTKLFFRADDCGRWPRELLHGCVIGLDHSIRSSTSSSARSSGDSAPLAFYYRVLWLRGVEALANGFFRANLLLPPPWWPVEIGLFPSQLSAFRAVLTAERLARATLRRELSSGRWREQRPAGGDAQLAFPSQAIVNEILNDTDAALGREFRARLTQQDDAAFLDRVGRGAWRFDQWMRQIGRESELGEEAAAVQELDDELRAKASSELVPLSLAAELLLLWSPRGRVRYFLMEQRELLLPESVQRVHVVAIVRQMLFVYMGFAWRRWCKFTARHRRHELRQRRETAAAHVQRWWRRVTKWRRQQLDGDTSISPTDALALYHRRQAEAAKLYDFLLRQWQARQRAALQQWRLHTIQTGGAGRQHEPPPPAAAWHPSHGIASLPRLPTMFAHKRPDGGVAIDDLKLYKQFRALHAGPTESSYWAIRHRVLLGVYPAGVPAFRDATRVVARADYTTSILLQEIGTFVCVAEPSELERHEPSVDAGCLVQLQQQRERSRRGAEPQQQPQPRSPRSPACQTPWLFERIVRAKHELLCAELAAAVRVSERHAELAQRELDAFTLTLPSSDVQAASLSADARAHLETLANKLTLAQHTVRRTNETLAALQPLDFVVFPIAKDAAPSDEGAFETFLVDLENRLRCQQRLYVFSMHGHGRTGLLAALLLGRLYGLTATEALDRAQRVHDCQFAMHGVGATRLVASPHAAPQVATVARLLARSNDAVYARVVRENSDERFIQWRAQQRGVPVEAFAARDGFMVSDRVDEATQAAQRREVEHLQRVAQRESAATKLQFARRRQQREREAMQAEEG